jgi:hypothetical protein
MARITHTFVVVVASVIVLLSASVRTSAAYPYPAFTGDSRTPGCDVFVDANYIPSLNQWLLTEYTPMGGYTLINQTWYPGIPASGQATIQDRIAALSQEFVLCEYYAGGR